MLVDFPFALFFFLSDGLPLDAGREPGSGADQDLGGKLRKLEGAWPPASDSQRLVSHPKHLGNLKRHRFQATPQTY